MCKNKIKKADNKYYCQRQFKTGESLSTSKYKFIYNSENKRRQNKNRIGQ